jgi:hypothetical protein
MVNILSTSAILDIRMANPVRCGHSSICHVQGGITRRRDAFFGSFAEWSFTANICYMAHAKVVHAMACAEIAFWNTRIIPAFPKAHVSDSTCRTANVERTVSLSGQHELPLQNRSG